MEDNGCFRKLTLAIVYILNKVNESRYKQGRVTPHFYTWQNLKKKNEKK